MIISYLRQRLRAVLARTRVGSRPTTVPAISHERVTAALVGLPDIERIVYLRHARDSVNLSDIAAELDLHPSQVEQHFASALVHLDRQIGTISPSEAVAHRSLAD